MKPNRSMIAWLWQVGAITAIAAAAGCSSGATASIPAAASPNVAETGTLQFAVGTATIGLAGNASSLGLNVVATFRQPNGNNATNVNTPTLSAPTGVNFGPLLGNSNVVGGVTPAVLAALAAQAQSQPPTTPFTVSPSFGAGFGPFVGVFGYGLAGDNLVSNSDLTAVAARATGQTNGFLDGIFCAGVATNYIQASTGVESFGQGYGAYYGAPPAVSSSATTSNLVRSAELGLPIPSGASIATVCKCPSVCAPEGSPFFDTAFPVQYFGGPPAWPSPQGYGNYSYFVGYPLGFTTFTARPLPGSYSLSVAYPTSATYGTFATIAKTARLGSVAPLAVFPQPVLTINPDGSGVVDVNVPAGVREAVVTIITNDCDLAGRELSGTAYANHYALETQQTGPQTLFLSPALGPPSAVNGQPTHTFCTVSDVQAYNAAAGGLLTTYNVQANVAAVGFDYPAVESSYPFNVSAAPPITNGDGHSGQADVTTSYPALVKATLTVSSGG